MNGLGVSILLAEHVQLQQNNTEVNVHRVFDSLTSNAFPVSARFWVLGKVWGVPQSDGEEARYRLVNTESGEPLSDSPPHEWQSQGPEQVHTAIHLFDGVTFPTEGNYQVQLIMSGRVVAYFPLRLVLAVPHRATAH